MPSSRCACRVCAHSKRKRICIPRPRRRGASSPAGSSVARCSLPNTCLLAYRAASMARTAPASPPTLPATAAPAVEEDDAAVELDVGVEPAEAVAVGVAVLHVGTLLGSVTPWEPHRPEAYLSVASSSSLEQALALSMQQTILLMKDSLRQKHPMSADLQPPTVPCGPNTSPTHFCCTAITKRSATETKRWRLRRCHGG